MTKSIVQLLDSLPSDNLTVKLLRAIDKIVPGEWDNVVGFDRTIQVVTGATDANDVLAIRNRAIELYNDPKNGYQSAMWYYDTIDSADVALGAAAMANKIGEKVGFLSFLNQMTPKANTTQSIDLGLKIVAELIAYSKLNGLPILNPKDFVTQLRQEYQGPSLIRMAALITVDGLLPLGPDFLKVVGETLNNQQFAIRQNPVFDQLAGSIPGADKVGFITNTFDAASGWMDNFVSKTGLTPQKISSSIGSFIDFSNDSMDFVAAFLDQSTDYYRHTGIQTVGRSLVRQANIDVNLSRLRQG
ncbi:MAG: hypothetical protein ACFBSE_27100 [Prochloraceae cyanobacterium]